MMPTSGGVERFTHGLRALDVVARLVAAEPRIERLRFTAYTPSPGLEERLAAEEPQSELRLFGAAKALAAHEGLPLWSAVMNAYLEDAAMSERLMDSALVHEHVGEREFLLERREVDIPRLDMLAARLDRGLVLALDSCVTLTDGQSAHIPMLDFRCRPSDATLETTMTALGRIGQRAGAILLSGRSYHYYGFELLDDIGWRAFLGRALLLAPLVDVRYVAHRLIDGFSRLRLTAADRKPVVPILVATLETAYRAPR